MCGIVGYLGPRQAVPLIVGGLEKLEYRGYDSAGVATVKPGGIDIYRAEGKLSNLKAILQKQDLLDPKTGEKGKTQVGMGHTRWATHGRPSETNAHPHLAGKVCVVHNGIIENYVELRERLQAKGCTFASETDTEIAAHLINSYLPGSKSLLEAVRRSLQDIQGSYGLVVISPEFPGSMVVARNQSPLIVGLAADETFVASDIPAMLEHTRRVIALEDGDLAEISADGVRIENGGKTVSREPLVITWDPVTAEKGGYRHFMLKEIHEQPRVIADTFRGRVDQNAGRVLLDDVKLTHEELKSITSVNIVACGTALHAGLVTRFYIERLAKLPVSIDYGSEFRYRTPLLDKNSLFVVVSQSGETADTLGSLGLAVDLGVKTLAICNVVGSSMTRKAAHTLYTHAGPEISVASTKAFTTQLTAGLLLALKLAEARGTLTPAEIKKHIEDLLHLPTLVQKALQFDKQLEETAKHHCRRANTVLFLGRGLLYPIALEGAIKLKEISYIHAEGYPAGEMKHGPIALINEETPVVVVLGRDGVNYEKALSNLTEVHARGGQIIAVTDHDNAELRKLAKDVIPVGEVPTLLLPVVLSIPLQLFAYHSAVCRGTDVDQPRNLAKSVTVE